jgi:excisionase family DNA binding protein
VKTSTLALSESSPYITVAESAEILRLSEISIRRFLTKKILVRHKVGGRTLLRRDDVLALVKAESTSAVPAAKGRTPR